MGLELLESVGEGIIHNNQRVLLVVVDIDYLVSS